MIRSPILTFVTTSIFHDNRHHPLDSYVLAGILELALAMVIIACITLACTFDNVGLGDKGNKNLGVIDAFCHGVLNVALNAIIVKPPAQPRALQTMQDTFNTLVVVTSVRVPSSIVRQEYIILRRHGSRW